MCQPKSGFGCLVAGFFIFLVTALRKACKIRLQTDPLRCLLVIGALSGLISMAFHSLFDFNLQIPANGLYFVMLIGIVDACLRQEAAGENVRRGRRRAGRWDRRDTQ